MPTSELIVYAVVVAGILLFNYVMRLIANRTRQQESVTPAAPPPPVFEEAADYSWGRADALQAPYELRKVPVDVAAVPMAMAPVADPAPSAARLHPAARRLLADGRELRNAMVLIAVLGRCRALEPHAE